MSHTYAIINTPTSCSRKVGIRMSSPSSWEIKEEIILENKDNIKNIITSKFKDNIWDDKESHGKMKLRYYKVVINPTLANQNYLSILISAKKKINIAKIKTNSHELLGIDLFPKHLGMKEYARWKSLSLRLTNPYSHWYFFLKYFPHYQSSRLVKSTKLSFSPFLFIIKIKY